MWLEILPHIDLVFRYEILRKEDCPPWLYEVKMGATSMLESWQCVLPNGRASSLSRNHYAFGCVGDWIYRRLGGIQALEPGYKRILFAPDFDSPLQWGKAAHLCDYGWIRCEWEKREDSIQILLEIPIGTEGVFCRATQTLGTAKELAPPALPLGLS